MTALVIIITFVLLGIIFVQIGKVSELSKRIRGEEEFSEKGNNYTALGLLLFMVVFLVLAAVSAYSYKNEMLGYGPNIAASVHGVSIDYLLNVTHIITGIVFVLTQVLLFWFSYKYRLKKGRKVLWYPHDTKLEMIWTGIPAVVLVYLLVQGLVVWNDVMPDVNADDEYIEFEATGYQFAWDLRYPGADGQLGSRSFNNINPANNPVGQDWSDVKNIDDFMPSEIVLPVGEEVRVTIRAKDVIHDFYLPQFRVKMDAVPGLPTYFIFTPTKTTEEYREQLKAYDNWTVPADPDDPEGPQRWEEFNYELACAELCGTGHYSMRRILRVVTREEYDKWFAEQSSYYLSNIRHTDSDPFKDELLDFEIRDRAIDLQDQFMSSLSTKGTDDDIINLTNVFYNTGSAELKGLSKHELENVAQLLKKNNNVKIELRGHTDNVGAPDMNQELSQNRAQNVMKYLSTLGISGDRMKAIGYGESNPIGDNSTSTGRQKNRRTEMKIIAQ